MSRVTNVLLACSVGEETSISKLNDEISSFLWGKEVRPFVNIGEANPKLIAGDMALETAVFLGAFNFLDLMELAHSIARVPWTYPNEVQLFVKDQEEERFKEISVYGLILNHRAASRAGPDIWDEPLGPDDLRKLTDQDKRTLRERAHRP